MPSQDRMSATAVASSLRYESASALAADFQRYLSDEPVGFLAGLGGGVESAWQLLLGY
jgi:hypothetical protein